jgi:NADPH oxidase
VLSVDTMVIVMPMCRNILRWLRPKMRWAPLDESQWFHRQVAYSMLFFTILHVAAHYVKYVYSNLRSLNQTNERQLLQR